ncbi:inositol phosphorylceramide synthase, partial [Thioclava sp. BHET1]
VASRFYCLLRHHRGARPIHWLAADLWSLLRDGERLAEGVLTMLMLSLFTACYGFFKGIIPALVPFSWDVSFAHLDKLLHGGVQPFTVLLPIFGNPYVLSGLNAAYQAWFLVMFMVVFIAAFATRDRAARQTFLCAFVLIWGLGGNLVATLLSSAGPCYYAQL